MKDSNPHTSLSQAPRSEMIRPADWRSAYARNPFVVLGAAFAVGYVLGGGLRTPFTARVLKLSARSFVVPELTARAKELIDQQQR